MKVRVRPGKASSLMSLMIGLVMIAVGLLVVIPRFGLFGAAWTVIAAGFTAYHAFNALTRRGVASQEIDLETFDSRSIQPDEMSDRLYRLDDLRTKDLITEEEYQRKRREIIEQL